MLDPIGENVFLKRIDEYDGALVLQVSPILRDRQGLRAKVLRVGPGAPLPDGSCAPMSVRRGDVVLVGRATGIDLSSTDGDILACRESDILVVLEYAH